MTKRRKIKADYKYGKQFQFSRPRIPRDALNTDLHLVGCVDAADELKIVGVWARFKRINDREFAITLQSATAF